MDLLYIDNSESSQISVKNRFSKGVWMSAPVILTGAILLSLSYIIDIIYTGGAELGIGETSALAKVLFGTGNVINKLISPILSGGIALYIGGLSALPGGLIGGMLTGLGVTLAFSSGTTGAITGIYGSLLAGLVAGYTARFSETMIKLITKKESNITSYITPAITLIITTTVVFISDAIAQLINGLASMGLAAAGDFSKLLLVVLLSIMITVDIGGPLYLASLVYGVTTIATEEPEIMASITAAGCVPVISIGLATLIYREKFAKAERKYALAGIFCGICGINQVAIPFYATRLQSVIIPSVIGGTISGELCLLFGCRTEAPAGGLLSVITTGTVWYYLLALLSGVLFSTAIMGYTLSTTETLEEQMTDNKKASVKKVTA